MNVQQETLPQRRSTRSEVKEEREELKLFVTQNSTIAIAAADRGENYYVLKVTSEGEEILQHGERDGYNCKYCRGS